MHFDKIKDRTLRKKIKITNKFFYKKYPYKVTLNRIYDLFSHIAYSRQYERMLKNNAAYPYYIGMSANTIKDYFKDFDKLKSKIRKDFNERFIDSTFNPYMHGIKNGRFLDNNYRETMQLIHLEQCLDNFFKETLGTGFSFRTNPNIKPFKASTSYNATFYFENSDHYVKFINLCKHHIREAYQPYSIDHVDIIKENVDYHIERVFRKKLFNGLYKYKIKINERYSTKETFDHLSQVFQDRKGEVELYKNYVSIVLLTNQIEDYGIIRLVTNDNDKIQEAVLIET